MASSLPKLRMRIVVSCLAVVIFLSVSCAEPTRCYWCGPLAEQVHRRERAPSCDVFHLEQHETVCDLGYTHCAIVVTSPPFTESRLCVKFYQDECYSLYCNSTKTWRMVCACRGNLCNGEHTGRETQAFLLLPKVMKTKPHKRNLVSHFISVKTKTPTEDDTVIIISKENETIYSMQGDQPSPHENVSHLYTPTPKHDEDNIIIVHGNIQNDEKDINHSSLDKAESNDETTMSSVEITMPVVNKEHDNIQPAQQLHNTEIHIDMHLDNAKISKPLNRLEGDKNFGNAEINKTINKAVADQYVNNSANVSKHDNITDTDKHLSNDDPGKQLDNVLNVNKSEAGTLASAEIDMPTTIAETVKGIDIPAITTSMKPTAEIAVAVQSSATPDKLPPAEALQQNVTPTKSMELSTVGTVATSTENHIIDTTLPTEAKNPNKKNSGAHILAHIIIFVISFLVHYCI